MDPSTPADVWKRGKQLKVRGFNVIFVSGAIN